MVEYLNDFIFMEDLRVQSDTKVKSGARYRGILCLVLSIFISFQTI